MSDEDAGGLCLCQNDSYLRATVTTVVSCTRINVTPAPAPAAGSNDGAGKEHGGGKGGSSSRGKGGKGGDGRCAPPASSKATEAASEGAASSSSSAAAAPEAAADGSCRYEVVLRETPMFPESGGQPCDTGRLLRRRKDGPTEEVAVLAVAWREGVLVHLTDRELPPGSEVEAVLDWDRRFDHMQQHTGQHVLSAVAWRLLGADTASWELHPLAGETHRSGDYCCVAVDLALPSISVEQMSALEAAANAELRALRRVAPLLLDPADPRDAEALAALAAGPDFRGRLPPPDKVKGRKLRLVHIEGLDVNACGGTHVRSSGEVQVLKLVGADRTRGHTRLRFMAGGRALAALAGCLGREAALTAKLTAPPGRHAEMVDMLLRERREASKARKLLSTELAERIGRELAAQAATAAGAAAPAAVEADGTNSTTATDSPGAGRCWAALHRPAADLDFLCDVAAAALEAGPGLQLLLLTADGTEPGVPPPPAKPGAEDSVEVTFLVAGHEPGLVKAAGAAVAAALGGRGGGRPGRFQGKASGMYKLPGAVRAFTSVLPPKWLESLRDA